jgi:polysaccharide deacetylase 2 family uncharacterized protein YibQ
VTPTSRGFAGTACLLFLASTVVADETPSEQTLKVAVVIDDLGHSLKQGKRAVQMVGPVALSILPNTPHGTRLAEMAHAAGKEVLLHLPMESVGSNVGLGEGALRVDSSRGEFARAIAHSMAAVPHVRGINNHMGSLLTRHPGAMGWLMEEMQTRGQLYFLDSFTTHRSVGLIVAREQGIPALKRDVFLDRIATPNAIKREFERLIATARQRGFAVAIGHPHPATLAFLEQHLPGLVDQGVELVSVESLLPYQAQQQVDDWYDYSSTE